MRGGWRPRLLASTNMTNVMNNVTYMNDGWRGGPRRQTQTKDKRTKTLLPVALPLRALPVGVLVLQPLRVVVVPMPTPQSTSTLRVCLHNRAPQDRAQNHHRAQTIAFWAILHQIS